MERPFHAETRIGFLDLCRTQKDPRPPAPRPLTMKSLERAGDESMEDVFLQDDLSPTIAEHAAQCQSLFHKYMIMPEIMPDPTIIDDQLARFSL